MLVKEIYLDLIHYEQSTLAHCIYYLLTEKRIGLDDDLSKMDVHFEQTDHQKIDEMIEKNVLGIHKVGIYSLKMDKKTFIFIYACSKEEAIRFFSKTYGQPPLNCHEYSLQDEIVRGNEEISFRNMRNEYNSFPAVAGYFEREVYG